MINIKPFGVLNSLIADTLTLAYTRNDYIHERTILWYQLYCLKSNHSEII